MKILWFTNTPCGYAEYYGNQIFSGGWMLSLEQELSKNEELELGISFYLNKKKPAININRVNYLPLLRKRKRTKIGRILGVFFQNNKNDIEEIEQIKEIIETFKPDIIHVHGTEDNFGLIAKHTLIPVVISLQGILNPYNTKYFSGIPREIISRVENKLNVLIGDSIKIKHKVFRLKAKRELEILKNAKYIIGRTEWDKSIVKILAPNHTYFKIDEMLRPSFYFINRTKIFNTKTLNIITVSSDSIYKGFETILETARLLKKNNLLNFKWIVIGLNKSSSIVKYTEKWKDLKCSDLNIELMGMLNETEIISCLNSSDVYVQVSHIENSPNSLCEAMISGIPIIASFAGGTDSLIEHNKEGSLYQDGDYYSLAGAILKLSKNYEKAQLAADNAKITAKNRHNKKNIVVQIINTYKAIISSEK